MIINRYNDFINESKIYDLILEANMQFTNDFIFIMNEIIENENGSSEKIASLILRYKFLQLDINTNYIGVSDEPSMLTFAPDDKIFYTINRNDTCNVLRVDNPLLLRQRKIDYSKCENLHLSNDEEFKIINSFKDIAYEYLIFYHIKLVNSGKECIIYLSTNTKLILNNVDKTSEIKIGRFVRNFLSKVGNTSFTDSDIEKFVNIYQTHVNLKKDILKDFRVIEGEEIKHWYNRDNYKDVRGGQLAQSCMSYMACQTFFEIYINNTEVCKMLILTKDDKLIGRALLWKTDGGNYMDRIYTNRDSYIDVFKEWGRRNEYLLYGELKGLQLKVSVKRELYDKYPYMDTFSHYSPSTGILSNDEDDMTYPLYELESTFGGMSDILEY